MFQIFGVYKLRRKFCDILYGKFKRAQICHEKLLKFDVNLWCKIGDKS